MNRLARWLAAVWLVLLTLGAARADVRPTLEVAQPASKWVIPSHASDNPQDLTPAALQWLDASGERTLANWLLQFNTAASPEGLSGGGFDWLDPRQPPLRRRSGAVWVAVPLYNTQAALLRHLVASPPRLEQLDAWLLGAGLVQPLGHSGLAVALSQRPLPTSIPAWAVTLPAGYSTLLLRIQSRTPMQPQLALWPPVAHALAVRQNDLYQGLESGALALAGLLAWGFALWLREASWAWYGAACLSMLVYQACFNGMAALWLWPAHPQWTLPALSLALAVAHASWVIFFVYFSAGHHQPAWARTSALGLAGLSGLGLVLVWVQGFGTGIALQEIAGLLLPLVLPWLAWSAWRRGDPSARFLLLSYGLLAAASVLRVADVRGWMAPAAWLENWFFPLGTILTTVVMLLALADRLLAMSRQQVLQARQHQQTLQTRISEATAELVQARDVAQAAMQFKSRFVARISHDLRTPLHTLLGNAALLQRSVTHCTVTQGCVEQHQLQGFLQAMERSGHDMLQLSDELLELVRGEAGRLALNPAPCHLPLLAHEVADSVRWLAQQRSNQLNLVLDVAQPDVRIDAVRVKQVLHNLLANACAATQNGSITLGLRSSISETYASLVQLEIWVADTGRGMAPEVLERIFEPFEQVDTDSATGSSGLGLAIARQWVRLMGSDIEVQSRPWVGSVFSWQMQVPLEDPGAPLPAAGADATVPALAAAWQGQVLVVDDLADQRWLLQTLLQGMGLEVAQADSGQAAIDWLQATAPERRVDLLITDWHMPEGDGLALLHWCRLHRPALAVVLLSGHPQPPDGFDAVLLKPVKPGQLHTVLQRLLPPPLDWAELRTLADGGDGLGVDAWITRHRSQLGDGPLTRGVITLGDSLQLAALVRWLA